MLNQRDSFTRFCAKRGASAAVFATMLLSGCVGEVVPLVTEFNGHSVRIVVDSFAANGQEVALAKATEICIQAGKSRAEQASLIGNSYVTTEILFLCL